MFNAISEKNESGRLLKFTLSPFHKGYVVMLSAAHDIIKSLDLNHSVSIAQLHINGNYCVLSRLLRASF